MSMIIVVDIGGTQIRGAAYRRGSLEPVEMLRTPTKGEGAAFERMCALIQSLWPQHESVEKIVVGSPGPQNPETGIIYSAPNIKGWDNFPIVPELEKGIGMEQKGEHVYDVWEHTMIMLEKMKDPEFKEVFESYKAENKFDVLRYSEAFRDSFK